MSANLGADAVFEWRDNFAAGRVVLGVSAEDERDIEREADGVTLNLHVAFLHDVEEGDLDFSGEVGQLVDGEDAAVCGGQQAVVMVCSLESCWPPPAALMGSRSPIRSATVTSA